MRRDVLFVAACLLIIVGCFVWADRNADRRHADSQRTVSAYCKTVHLIHPHEPCP